MITGRISADVFVDYPDGYPGRFPFPIWYELRLAGVGEDEWKLYRDFSFHSGTAVHLYFGFDPDRVYRYQLRACWDVPVLVPRCSDWTPTRYIEPVDSVDTAGTGFHNLRYAK